MRPPVAMPDAEMMIAGPASELRRLDSSTRPTISKLGGSERVDALADERAHLGVVLESTGAVDGGRLASHRRVEEDRQRRDGLVLDELAQEVEHLLSAVDRERGDEDDALAGGAPR